MSHELPQDESFNNEEEATSNEPYIWDLSSREFHFPPYLFDYSDSKHVDYPEMAIEAGDEFHIEFNGVELNLVTAIRNFLNAPDEKQLDVKIRAETIEYSASGGKRLNTVAGITVIFKMCEGDGVEFDATTKVWNNDRSLKGLGRELWTMSVSVIQGFSDETDAPVLHKVQKKPTSNLSTEKWDSLFLDLLESHGYHRVSDTEWEAMYVPSQYY